MSHNESENSTKIMNATIASPQYTEEDKNDSNMVPISAIKASESPSTDDLIASNDSLNEKGVSNQAFDDNDVQVSQETPANKESDAQTEPLAETSEQSTPSQVLQTDQQTDVGFRGNGHSRGASGVSVGLPANHSRGTSSDCSSGSRRGTYSEAGTLPIGTMTQEGTPIMEENGSSIQITEKTANGLDNAHSNAKRSNLQQFCRSVMRTHNQLPPDPSKTDGIKYAFSCPPHGTVGRCLTWMVGVVLVWVALIGITHEQALPGGNIFSLVVLVMTAQAAGVLVSKIRLPPLLGMLLVGILFRSVGSVKIIGESIDSQWSSTIRSVALVVILIRAGLGLDPEALKKLSFVVLRLAATPCLVETVTVAVMSHLLLAFPWKWGFMLGFILAAVSPAVVVPCLLSLSEQGYGVDKGIPTLVIAAASIDDVIAISGFGITLGVTFSTGSPLWQGMKGPLEFIIGILFGVVVGLVLWVLPNRKELNSANLRFFLLFASGMFAIFGSKFISFGGAGALGCLCVSFVAGVGWRKHGSPQDLMKIKDNFNVLWLICQPMLFGLIGAEIDVSKLDGNTIGLGVLCLVVGLALRVITSFFAVMGGGLSVKERFFVALAWLPKATVQAAIGSTALDFAREANTDPSIVTPEEQLGVQVLTIAVLVILITAPIGSAAIMLSAPKLLHQTPAAPGLETEPA